MDEAGQPGDALALRALHVSTVPFEDVYPSTATHESALDAWFEVPAGESRVLEFEPDDHPPYSFGLDHGYRVTLEREAGSEQSLDLVLDDAIRHPLRR